MEYQKKSVAVEGFEMYQVDTNGKVLLNYAAKDKPLHMTTLYGSGKWLLVRTTGRSCMSQLLLYGVVPKRS